MKDFLKFIWDGPIYGLISIILLGISAHICILISGPATAVMSALGVWLCYSFVTTVWNFVARGSAKGRNCLTWNLIGALIWVLVAIFFTGLPLVG